MGKFVKSILLILVATFSALTQIFHSRRPGAKLGLSGRSLLYVDYKKPVASRGAGERFILSFLDYVRWYPAFALGHTDDAPVTITEYIKTVVYLAKIRSSLSGYDYVFIKTPELYWLANIMWLGRRPRVVYYSTDIFTHRLASEINTEGASLTRLVKYWTYALFEDSLWCRADIIFTNRLDERSIIARVNADVRLVPARVISNLSDVTRVKKLNTTAQIIFVGGVGNAPNIASLRQFILEIADRLVRDNWCFQLTVVGRGWDEEVHSFLERSYIRLLGSVSDEGLRDVYREADYAVGFMPYGAGIKGKVIEAMEHGVYVLANDIGAEGIPEDVLHRLNGYNDIKGAVVKASADPDFYKTVINRYHKFLREHYSECALKRALDPHQ